MKSTLLSLFAFLFFSFYTNAQELQRGRSIFIQSGTVNSGFHVATGFEKLFGRDFTNSIFISANYQQLRRSVEVVDMVLEEQNAFLHMGYRKYFPVSYKVSPYIGVGLLAGYQHQGYSESGIYEHEPSDEFLYGAAVHSGIAYRFNALSIFLEGAYMYEFDHSWLISAGIKYSF